MKTNEHDYYNELANWSFEDINYTSEVFTDWIYEDEIKKRVNENTRILDLGTAAGEKVLKKFPDCAEILGTDFSNEMIKTANKNLLQSGRKNISFRVMDNLKMDVLLQRSGRARVYRRTLPGSSGARDCLGSQMYE